jgi:hypothetical protein
MKQTISTSAFNKLSKKKKAVLVAEDVLAQLKAEKYIAKADTYITFNDAQFDGGQDIKSSFDGEWKCKSCAIGSMLLSCTHLGNKLTFGDIGIYENDSIVINEDMYNAAVKALFNSVFHPHQLLLIETAFEGYNDWDGMSSNEIKKEKEDFEYNRNSHRWAQDVMNETLSYEECVKCNKFFLKYQNDEKTLIAICNNIILNSGEFVL